MVLPILGNSHFSATQIKSHLTPLFFSCTTFNGWGNLVSFSKCVKNLSVSHHFYCYCQATVFLFVWFFFFCSNTNSLLRSLPASVFIFLQSLPYQSNQSESWTSGSGEAFLSPKRLQCLHFLLRKKAESWLWLQVCTWSGYPPVFLLQPQGFTLTILSAQTALSRVSVWLTSPLYLCLSTSWSFALTRLTHITSTTPILPSLFPIAFITIWHIFKFCLLPVSKKAGVFFLPPYPYCCITRD